MFWLLSVFAVCATGCSEDTSSNTPDAGAPVSDQSVDAALDAAAEYLAAQKYTNAELILEKLVERAPTSVDAWEMLGQVHSSQAMRAEAQQDVDDASSLRSRAYACYAEVVKLRPDSAGLQHSAGIMALHAGLQVEALRHFRTAGLLDDRNVQHPLYEAQVLLLQGSIVEAEDALLRALAIDADEPFTLSSLAVVAMELGDHARAIELIEEARMIDPESVELRVQAARIRRRAGQEREAVELLQPLSAEQRAMESVAWELASAYEAVDDYERAGMAWEHRVRRFPTDLKAAHRAMKAYLKAGKQTEAVAMLELLRLTNPNASLHE